jgi:hypothetical protein
VAHPNTIGGVYKSGCVRHVGFVVSVSMAFSYSNSVKVHRQFNVNASSGTLQRFNKVGVKLIFSLPCGRVREWDIFLGLWEFL